MEREQLNVRGFRYDLEIYNLATGEVRSRETRYNRIPQAGIDFLIQSPFGDIAAVPNFYCGLFRNNVVPSSGLVAADIPTTLGEFTEYSEATRPEWVKVYNGLGSYDNLDSKAVFTPTADRNIYGAFLVSNSTKGSNTGLLLSVVRFATMKPVYTGEAARLAVSLTYVPTNVT